MLQLVRSSGDLGRYDEDQLLTLLSTLQLPGLPISYIPQQAFELQGEEDMRHIQRCLLMAACVPLFGCASSQSAWWNDQETQGEPGQTWTKRYTSHSFSRSHHNVQRDATRQLERWAAWKCPTGYETHSLRVVEKAPPPPSSGLLSLYYGSGLGIRQSLSMEMDIACRDSSTLANNTITPSDQQ